MAQKILIRQWEGALLQLMESETQIKAAPYTRKDGFLFALLAYGTWGLLPIFWKQLKSVGADEILAHRVLWCFVFTLGLLLLRGRFQELKESFRKHFRRFLICSCLLSSNWLVYVWAVNNNHIVESSLGYFLCPLVTVALGFFVLKEDLSAGQWLAVFLAAMGVVTLAYGLGVFPWISVYLAVSFALYGLIRKQTEVAPLVGLAIETSISSPIALGFLCLLAYQGKIQFLNTGWQMDAYLVGAGLATALPLVWFARAARGLNLISLGLMQYIAPVLQLACGVFLYGESLSLYHKVALGFIWLGLGIYSFENYKKFRRSRMNLAQNSA